MMNNVINGGEPFSGVLTSRDDLPISQLMPVHLGSQIHLYLLTSSWHFPLTHGLESHSSISGKDTKVYCNVSLLNEECNNAREII